MAGSGAHVVNTILRSGTKTSFEPFAILPPFSDAIGEIYEQA